MLFDEVEQHLFLLDRGKAGLADMFGLLAHLSVKFGAHGTDHVPSEKQEAEWVYLYHRYPSPAVP